MILPLMYLLVCHTNISIMPLTAFHSSDLDPVRCACNKEVVFIETHLLCYSYATPKHNMVAALKIKNPATREWVV